MRESMQNYPELWIAAARYAATGGQNADEALALIMLGKDIRRAQSLAHWRQEASDPIPAGVRQGGKTRGENHDRPAIAFFMDQAITRLIELVDGPAAMSEVLNSLLSASQPHDAKMRAKLQALLLRCPHLTTAELAKKAKCDRSLANRYLSDGTIRRVP